MYLTYAYFYLEVPQSWEKSVFNLFPDLCFLFIVGLWPSVKMHWLLLFFFLRRAIFVHFWTLRGQSLFLKKESFIEDTGRILVTAEVLSLPLGNFTYYLSSKEKENWKKASGCQLIRILKEP